MIFVTWLSEKPSVIPPHYQPDIYKVDVVFFCTLFYSINMYLMLTT